MDEGLAVIETGATGGELEEMLNFGIPPWEVDFSKRKERDPLLNGAYLDEKGKPFVAEIWSGDGILRTEEQCRAWADHLGCEVRYPTPSQLFVDIDNEQSWAMFQMVWGKLRRHLFSLSSCKCFPGYTVSPSKSGGDRRHVVVEMGMELSEEVRIGLQAVLGSDPMREMISLVRNLRNGEREKRNERVSEEWRVGALEPVFEPIERVVCFFEPKPGKGGGGCCRCCLAGD